MTFFRGCAGPMPFGGLTTRTPITPPYFQQAGHFGARRFVPGIMPRYSGPFGNGNFRPTFGCEPYYNRPFSSTIYPSPFYANRNFYRSNQIADAAIVGGLFGVALGALFNRRY